MAIPVGAISNTAVSLTKAVKNPALSNILAVSTTAAQITGDPNTTRMVTNSANLVSNATRLLESGSPESILGTANSAVKLAQGFLDPNTASVVGQVAGGLNQIFGLGGPLSLFGGMGGGMGKGNKPIGLHTDTLPQQTMSSAYSEGKDVVFSFVRMDGALGVNGSALEGAAGALTGAGALADTGSPLSSAITSAAGGQFNSLSAASSGVVQNAGLGSLKGSTFGAIGASSSQFTAQ